MCRGRLRSAAAECTVKKTSRKKYLVITVARVTASRTINRIDSAAALRSSRRFKADLLRHLCWALTVIVPQTTWFTTNSKHYRGFEDWYTRRITGTKHYSTDNTCDRGGRLNTVHNHFCYRTNPSTGASTFSRTSECVKSKSITFGMIGYAREHKFKKTEPRCTLRIG